MVPSDGMRMGFVIQETTYLPQKVGEVIYLYEPSPSAKLEYECPSLCSCFVRIPGQAGSVDVVIRCLFPFPFPSASMLSISYVSSQCPFCPSGMPCPLPSHWISLDILPSVVSWRLPLSSIWKFGASFDLVWTIGLSRDWWMGIGKAVECLSGRNIYF